MLRGAVEGSSLRGSFLASLLPSFLPCLRGSAEKGIFGAAGLQDTTIHSGSRRSSTMAEHLHPLLHPPPSLLLHLEMQAGCRSPSSPSPSNHRLPQSAPPGLVMNRFAVLCIGAVRWKHGRTLPSKAAGSIEQIRQHDMKNVHSPL